jgi:hypothetical protein
MRVLVATNELQGSTLGDYAHTVEGELVLVEVATCGSPEECGCGRDWPGMASRKATTTAMVVDLPHLSEGDLRLAITDWLDTSGWNDLFRSPPEADGRSAGALNDIDEMIDAMVDEHLELIADVCESFPVGSVLERRGAIVQERTWPAAA